MTALRNRRARSSSNHPNTIISAVEIDFALDNQNPRCGERSKLVWTQPARGRQRVFLTAFLLTVLFASALSGIAATANGAARLAAIPPMGWNDWAHYQCNFNDQTILANAKALVTSGLSKHGYNTVTIDDCWMQKTRDAQGNLQADPQRFPHGIEPIAQAVHALGLQFGIYEDAGYETCGGFAGSGEAKGRGKGHFLQDAKLFASWGVDYLKLDGCNVYVSEGSSKVAAYRKAYAAQSAALKSVSRPIVFSESAPAYFQGTPDWYVVLKWVRDYGQLWREGTDIATFDPKQPNTPRFDSVLWNYAYNLPLGRFQKPANWNDADFIIGGDSGMSMAETRSQLALWSMMSAPLILSSDLDKLTPEAVAILGNPSILAIDQDRLGRMATLVRRSPGTDVLMKTLSNGDYAIAVLNRSDALARTELRSAGFGFKANSGCHLDATDLWSGNRQDLASSLRADIAPHDIAIWRIHPTASCGRPARMGAITMIASGRHRHIKDYSQCLSSSGSVGACAGTPGELWTVGPNGILESAGKCLDVVDDKPQVQACSASGAEHWRYTLAGNLVGTGRECLTATGTQDQSKSLALQPCGDNQPDQIWSLPN